MNQLELVKTLLEVVVGAGQSPEPRSSSVLQDPPVGTCLVVRCSDAGVHYGEFVARDGRYVALTNSRRLWRFDTEGTGSCTEASRIGPQEGSRVCSVIPEQVVLLDACELLPCTDVAVERFRAFKAG